MEFGLVSPHSIHCQKIRIEVGGMTAMATPVRPTTLLALQITSTFAASFKANHPSFSYRFAGFRPAPFLTVTAKFRLFSSNGEAAEKVSEKPSICTADELHYVPIPSSGWKIALWRYRPNPQVPRRNHPLMLLSGVGTNAIAYDLSPESSFARYMCGQGFDTWVVDVRGCGLSMEGSDSANVEKLVDAASDQMKATVDAAADGNSHALPEQTSNYSALSSISKGDPTKIPTLWNDTVVVTKLTETFMRISARFSSFLSEAKSKIMSGKFFHLITRRSEDSLKSGSIGKIQENISSLLEVQQNSTATSHVRELSQKLVNLLEESQRSVSAPFFNLQEHLSATIEDIHKQINLIIKYEWDFDHYLEEDVPAAMEFIRGHCKPKDGKVLAIGHSMGGILLYAMLSRCGFGGKDPGLAAVVTLASSLDYNTSKSSLKMLLPLVDPAKAVGLPVVPLGALVAATHPLSSASPYIMSWLNHQISAQDMMHPELLKKLILNGFCHVSANLMFQLRTAFQDGGLRDRSGKFLYKSHLKKSSVPVLALAGDNDQICPPEAVFETVKHIHEDLVSCKVFGGPEGPHYAHYDLVGGQLAVKQVYPCIIEFLSHHD